MNEVASVDGDTIALTFSAGVLPDETCYRIDLAGAVTGPQGAALTGDTDCLVRALLADATGSGDVNLGDALLAKIRVGQSAAAAPQLDFNLTGGVINQADALLAKSRIAKPARTTLCPEPPCPNGGSPLCGCADLMWDALNCGACGHACQPTDHCSWGECYGPCLGCE